MKVCARVIVPEHYLSLGALRFPRATLSGNVLIRSSEEITNIRAYLSEKIEAIADTIANQNVC